jgi:Glucodextranase, domain N
VRYSSGKEVVVRGFPNDVGRLASSRRARLALAALLVAGFVSVGGTGARAEGSAPGGPGAVSHFDLARKDCLGTARNTTSKTWYTVANGVLSDL